MGKKGRRKTKFIPLVFPAEVVPSWTELPLDLTANILRRLGDVDILHGAQFVCSTWWKVCRDPYMWRTINIANKDSIYMDHCTTLYRCAVDRSQGQLIDLTIGFFMHDELLYIAERSSHLRRLTIVWCMLLSRTTLIEAVKLLPELEELHLIMPPFDLLSEDIETIGLSCPRLKSFTLDRPDEFRCNCDHDHDDDDEFEEEDDDEFEEEDDDEFEEEEEDDDDAINKEAAAIARSMHNLQHLVLANAMNNKGLAAILDGCRRLESLDLRRCFGVDPDEELGERCFEQIKHVRLLSDEYSVDDDDNGWDFSSQSSINKGRSGRMPSHSFSYWLDDGNGNGGGYVSEFDDYDYDDNRMTADQIEEYGKKLAF